jgi:hypothetical protein
MIITVTASSDNLSFYRATSSAGIVLAERTRTPLLDSARTLMVMSTGLSTHALAMYHEGATNWALRATSIGYAAQFDVVNHHRQGPIFVHRDRKEVPGEARTAVLPSG